MFSPEDTYVIWYDHDSRPHIWCIWSVYDNTLVYAEWNLCLLLLEMTCPPILSRCGRTSWTNQAKPPVTQPSILLERPSLRPIVWLTGTQCMFIYILNHRIVFARVASYQLKLWYIDIYISLSLWTHINNLDFVPNDSHVQSPNTNMQRGKGNSMWGLANSPNLVKKKQICTGSAALMRSIPALEVNIHWFSGSTNCAFVFANEEKVG